MKLDFETASEVDKAFTKGPLCEAYLELQEALKAELAKPAPKPATSTQPLGTAHGVVRALERELGLTREQAIEAMIAVAMKEFRVAGGVGGFIDRVRVEYPTGQ